MNAVAALTVMERAETGCMPAGGGDFLSPNAPSAPKGVMSSSFAIPGEALGTRPENSSNNDGLDRHNDIESLTTLRLSETLRASTTTNNLAQSGSEKTATVIDIAQGASERILVTENITQSVSKTSTVTMGAQMSKSDEVGAHAMDDCRGPRKRRRDLYASGEGLTSQLGYEDTLLAQDGALEDDIAMMMEPLNPQSTEDSTQSAVEGRQIRAFAKLEFDDGPFYMNTYAVELGRDMRAAKAAVRQFGHTEGWVRRNSKRSSSSLGNGPQQPSRRVKRSTSARVSMSLVSESGGVMGVDEPDPEDIRRWRRATSGSTHANSRRNSGTDSSHSPEPETIDTYWLRKRPRKEPKLDPFNLLPSPEECPLIPIHPPAISAETGGHRGISRKHVKIAYNFDRHVFELQIIGRNGAFVDDRWHASGETVALRSGAQVQIGGVGMRFVLPEDEAVEVEEVEIPEENGDVVAGGDDNADGELSSGSDTSNEGESDEDVEMGEAEEGQDAEEPEEDEDEEEDEEEPQKQVVEESRLELPKRRGPGRPPKHGRYMKKPRLEEPTTSSAVAKSGRKPKVAPPPVTEKRKVGRPRKHPRPEDAPAKPEKRKYVRRKGVEQAGGDGGPAGKEAGATKEKKEAKSKRPPRSPSPVFDESTLTEQDLAKPQSSYVVLIHEALTNAPSGTLSLPQIYRAIERKYPYFKLRVTTNGWQSSVRHNLSQHDAFQKLEREGKGWVWGLVPGVTIEKEKRRKATSPPVTQQQQRHTLTKPGTEKVMNTGLPLPPSFAPPPPVQPAQGIPLNRHPSSHGPFAQNNGMQGARPGGSASGGGYRPSHAPPSQLHHPQINNTNNYDNQHSPFTTAENPVPNGTRNGNTPTGYDQGHGYPQNPRPEPSKFIGGQSPRGGGEALPSTSTSSSLAPPPRPGPPAAAPTSTGAPTPSHPHPNPTKAVHITPDILTAVQSFKSGLLNSMPKTAHSETVVQSAIDRALGLSDRSRLEGLVDGQEDPQEMTVMKALSRIIHGSTNTDPSSSSSSSVSSSMNLASTTTTMNGAASRPEPESGPGAIPGATA